MNTEQVITEAVETVSTTETIERLRGYGLDYDALSGWVLRQVAAGDEIMHGPSMLAGVLFGIEVGRASKDPSFELDPVRVAAQDDPRGERDA